MDTKLNSGAIFKNKSKTEGDNKPDYKGQIDCDGVKKDIALWLRTSDSGVTYFSVKLSEVWTPTEARQDGYASEPRDMQPPATEKFTPAPASTSGSMSNTNDDVPF